MRKLRKCSITDCDLDSYPEHDECILHCSKENLNFLEIKLKFNEALKKYVVDNNDGGGLCYLYNIAFPKPDTRSTINYIKILESVKQLYFQDCDFFTEYLKIDKSEICFDNCRFHHNWVMYNYALLKNIDNVIYQNCVFFKKVKTCIDEKTWLYEYDYSQFDYTCTFDGYVVFYRAAFKLPPFHSEQSDSQSSKSFKLLVDDCKFVTFELHLSKQGNREIEFKKCSFKTKLKIRSADSGDYKLSKNNKSKLRSLKIIDCYVSDAAYIRIGYLDVDEFVLSNLRNPQNAELNIGDCHFKTFKLSNFRNMGRFKLYKINVIGEEKNILFQIDNTSIGDADFQSICLTSFETVRLFDNIFANINYTNMQWKEIVEVGQYESTTFTEIAKKRDTYRVLKNVAQKNNDQPQALIFYAKEMQYHKEITFGNRCRIKDFKRFFIKDIFCKHDNGWLIEGRSLDIIILFFNEKTNNFGLNWWQPIKLLLIFSFVFYLALLFSLDCNNPMVFLKNYFEFINPTHGVEFIAKGKWTYFSFLVDFTFRIIEGLLIYQTIIAFRKFTKK